MRLESTWFNCPANQRTDDWIDNDVASELDGVKGVLLCTKTQMNRAVNNPSHCHRALPRMTLTICSALLNAVCLCFLRRGRECIRVDDMRPRSNFTVKCLLSYRFSFCAMQLTHRRHEQVCPKCSASLSDRDRSTLSVHMCVAADRLQFLFRLILYLLVQLENWINR